MTIIFLNGVTSSGKSTLAKALQETLPGLWLVSGIDAAIGMAPQRLHHHHDGFFFDTNSDGHVRLNFGVAGKALLAAHRRACVALAGNGVNLILDEVLATPDMRALWLKVLKDSEVWFVGVHCELAQLERREVARGDRRLGQARGQFKHVHDQMTYDIELDTTCASIHLLCARVVKKLASKDGPIALSIMIKTDASSGAAA
jgi:chloramphenicol 3-O phosphotransferase